MRKLRVASKISRRKQISAANNDTIAATKSRPMNFERSIFQESSTKQGDNDQANHGSTRGAERDGEINEPGAF